MARGDGVKQLGHLLQVYKNRLVAPQKTVEDAFKEVVYDVLGFELGEGVVRYTPANKTLSVTGSGVVRSELLLHQEELLNHLKGRLGDKSCPEQIR